MNRKTEQIQTLFIKNMVCPRCISAVQKTLTELGMEVQRIELGSVDVKGSDHISDESISEALAPMGFELLKGKDQRSVEQIKTHLIRYVRELEQQESMPKLSDYLSEAMHRNYASLSHLFSELEETTIEKYLIYLKMERVKELLSYNELTLSEIAWKLKYSSVQYLSNQFRQVTGMSVTDYKKASDSFRSPLDSPLSH